MSDDQQISWSQVVGKAGANDYYVKTKPLNIFQQQGENRQIDTKEYLRPNCCMHYYILALICIL